MQSVPVPVPTFRLAASCVAAVALSVVATSASAVLLNTLSVDLIAPLGVESDPTPFTFSQAAPLATGVLASNLGGAGPISGYMLNNEQITFSGNSILIRVAAGSVNGLNPGYGTGARYQLNGLAVLGEVITGFTAYAFDGYGTTGTFSGLNAGVLPNSLVQLGAGATSLSFKLDNTLTFVDRGLGGSNNYAEFRIDLLSQPIPEPGTWLMMFAGLGGMAGLVARRRSQRV